MGSQIVLVLVLSFVVCCLLIVVVTAAVTACCQVFAETCLFVTDRRPQQGWGDLIDRHTLQHVGMKSPQFQPDMAHG